ncbi:hypothetical protein [Streptomyces mirabilis]|uniref:hypothetical protein n=1 Tax=Streptomyces mirabilis TaxID=68239 RepID=UPI0036CCBB20
MLSGLRCRSSSVCSSTSCPARASPALFVQYVFELVDGRTKRFDHYAEGSVIAKQLDLA